MHGCLYSGIGPPKSEPNISRLHVSSLRDQLLLTVHYSLVYFQIQMAPASPVYSQFLSHAQKLTSFQDIHQDIGQLDKNVGSMGEDSNAVAGSHAVCEILCRCVISSFKLPPSEQKLFHSRFVEEMASTAAEFTSVHQVSHCREMFALNCKLNSCVCIFPCFLYFRYASWGIRIFVNRL